MSGASFSYHGDGSVATEELSQNDSKYMLISDKNINENQSKSLFNLNKNSGIESFTEQTDTKDNFNINIWNLNCENKNYVNNENFKNTKNFLGNVNDGMVLPKGQEDMCSVDVVFDKVKTETKGSDENKEFAQLKLFNSENEKVNNSLSTEETDQVAMKAAFTKVVERFGLSTPEGRLDDSQIFYGVYIPSDTSVKSNADVLHVYTEKSEALKVMKQSKKARLKQFKTKKEAVSFVVHGSETPAPTTSVQCASSGEKVMPFKCPKVQDMIAFKKAIENGDVEDVKRKITDNPRYLVSSGDTPSILQEGPRYNALHVAAKSKNLEIAVIILDSITNEDFISHLYDDNDLDWCRARIEVLLDLYLNMPDKGLNETPLHIAVKYGAVDLVEYLISYPQCQRNLPNTYGQRPKDIICSRVNVPCETAKEAISALLEEQYYIPVLRYEDNTFQPRVGEAFSPSKPLNISEDLLSPRIEIHAFAGPMSKENAELFKKKWKSPPRLVKHSCQSPSLRLQDMEKGLERIGRNLASEFNVPWKEYWPFLETFIDLSSEQGLLLLENYLKKRFEDTLEQATHCYSSNAIRSGEKAWSPINALCEAMRFCSLNDDAMSPAKKLKWSTWSADKHDARRKNDDMVETDGRNPLLYVERSCEVFGKRIASALSSISDPFGAQAEIVHDSLEAQVKHLMPNILSYREDDRFRSVDFQMIHSRVAAVAIHSLVDFTDRERSQVLNCLKDVEKSDAVLSDDDDLNANCRNLKQEPVDNSVKEHLRCLVKNLIAQINDFSEKCEVLNTTARNEADCARLWSHATPCNCTWSSSTFIRPRIGIKRKSSKFMRNNFDPDIRLACRRVFPEDPAENEANKVSVEKAKCATDAEENEGEREGELVEEEEEEEEEEEIFHTPPSCPSDSEEETMEDPMDLPDTFIYEGPVPSKIDYAVLNAIESSDFLPEKYPNICRWKHLVALHSRSPRITASKDSSVILGGSAQKKQIPIINTPNSSPGKILCRSPGSCDISRRSGSVEPWERILGRYSPRTPRRGRSLIFNIQDSPIKR